MKKTKAITFKEVKMNRKKKFSMCAILLMLSIISCSSSDSTDNNDSMAMTDPTATSMPTDNNTMSPKSKEISEVNINMSEWDVNVVSENSLIEGSIKLTLTNSGNLEHNMVLINDENYENLELTEDSSICLLYTSPSPRDGLLSRMPSSA